MNDGKDGTIRIGTWNTALRAPKGEIGENIRGKLAAAECDVLCVTEGSEGILPDRGHVIDAGEDWGCPIKEGRRKVLLWSKQHWTRHTYACLEMSQEEKESHKGRFVAGTTQSASGERLTVIGVCIPWPDAHVRTCRKDRKRWQEHKLWLAGFEKLRCRLPESRTVVLGDFNQTIPRTRAPKEVFNALTAAFASFKFATEGAFFDCLMTIDHIAYTRDLHFPPSSIKFWPKYDDGLYLSDHCGVRGVLREPARQPAGGRD